MLVAFAVVLVAEIGDKSQLVALSLASKFSPWVTLAAVVTASMVLHGLAATVGVALAHAISHRTRAIVAGSLFIGFAAWTLWRGRGGEGWGHGRQAGPPISTDPRPNLFFRPTTVM